MIRPVISWTAFLKRAPGVAPVLTRFDTRGSEISGSSERSVLISCSLGFDLSTHIQSEWKYEGTEPEPLMPLTPPLLEPLTLLFGSQGTKRGVLHYWAKTSRDSRMRTERWGRRQERCIFWANRYDVELL